MNKETFDRTPINWAAINSIDLNDFVAYDNLLFTDEEQLQYDNYWEKYIKYNEEKRVVGVYMPFSNPQTAKEFALNHYVYWMVLYYTEIDDKICYFYDYNTKKIMNPPRCYCWACSYDNFILKQKPIKLYGHSSCEFCPLWHEQLHCEEKGQFYKQWVDGDLEKAKDVAEMTWSDFDYLLK